MQSELLRRRFRDELFKPFLRKLIVYPELKAMVAFDLLVQF